jgi:hypothetical protein
MMNQPNNNFSTMQYGMDMPNFVPPVPQITGSAGGTSIVALKNMQNNGTNQNIPINTSYARSMPNYQQPNTLSDAQIAQIMGVAKSPVPEMDPQENEAASQNIKHLVKDLNKSLDGYGPSKKSSRLTDDSENDTDEEDNPKIKKKNQSYGSYIPTLLKEPLLLLIIYIIMSQSFVKKAITTYVPQLENNLDGSKTFLGIVMYGAILAVLFTLFKKILL